MKPGQSSHAWAKRIVNAGLIAMMAFGCRTKPQDNFPRIINEPGPVTDSMRKGFGVMGILPVALATNTYFYAPKDGSGVAGRVAGQTWNWNEPRTSIDWSSVRSGDDALGAAAGVGFIGLTSLAAGVVAGAIFGVSEEQFKAGEARLRQALREDPLETRIDREMAKALAAQPSTNVRVLTEASLPLVKLSGGATDLSGFATLGLDTILDVRVAHVGFELRNGINPEVSFVPIVVTCVVRVRDGAVLHATYLDYRGSKKPFTTWAEYDAKAFRSELRRSGQQFARSILEHYVVPDTLKKQ